ncbi:MAG TPA: AMIN domain-containing protein [Gemmatimonadales bacterium]|nr:AMIN domain-containing protein [Gemmatimonadales bacterium]
MIRSLTWMLPAALVVAPAAAVVRPAPDGQVTAVSLSSQGGTAQLAIAVTGPVTVKDFTLTDPARLVLDLEGASLADLQSYDGQRRGSVRAVRVRAQDGNVVRVVLEFDRLPTYRTAQVDGMITVAFADEAFAAWSTGGAKGLAVAPATLPTPQPAEAVPAAVTRERALNQLASGTLVGMNRSFGSKDDERISVSFNRATMQEVATVFSRYSGRSILVGPGITREVTAEIVDQPWSLAFRAILANQGLSVMEMEGGILRIDSPGELAKLDSVETLETRVVRLNYTKAGELAKSIEGLITPNRGKVVADTTLNALVITDTRTRVANITEFAQGLDIKTPTISIQAKLVFVDRTDLQQLGLKYDIGSNGQFFNKLIQRIDPLTGQPYNPNVNIVNLGGQTVSAISNADALIPQSALDLVFSTAIGGFSVTSFLSALEQVQITDVEAVPIIHTLDNRQATILSGQETPVRVIDASSFGQVNQAPRANVQFKETGIKLIATPSVTADRQIRMDIEVERSSIQALAAADLGFTIPKQNAKSRLLVGDGETAVIGGLTETTVTRNRQGIPLLSSLPFVGNLFAFTENRESRKDLIVLVTPRIVDDAMPQ